jgi:hypothetical protein
LSGLKDIQIAEFFLGMCEGVSGKGSPLNQWAEEDALSAMWASSVG